MKIYSVVYNEVKDGVAGNALTIPIILDVTPTDDVVIQAIREQAKDEPKGELNIISLVLIS